MHELRVPLQHAQHACVQVRNTANGIVQFQYGDDGRDPVAMEGDNGKPLDLERMLSHLRATTCPRGASDPSDDSRRFLQPACYYSPLPFPCCFIWLLGRPIWLITHFATCHSACGAGGVLLWCSAFLFEVTLAYAQARAANQHAIVCMLIRHAHGHEQNASGTLS